MNLLSEWTTYEDWNFTNFGSKGEKMTVPGCARGRGYVRVSHALEYLDSW